ncbi:hypothetical protein EJ05DRAFT_236372 [Pseudovirgaria hyperparasitica]|uniref:Uncharacterized protein n=1 Tax=Pseudovirgaria hyperparasitica TaxID=470096 RepID=A0A6A6VUG1_9PEZI|nr:uncharacterized protein EJ05DRAFT_236372 [Pseudovirgaria hyperparasitica]KAF2752887.1 hypothetical protein EJ05DRAFT_236372 [Pseudovirgaria hyperparasitica]
MPVIHADAYTGHALLSILLSDIQAIPPTTIVLPTPNAILHHYTISCVIDVHLLSLTSSILLSSHTHRGCTLAVLREMLTGHTAYFL